MAQGLSVFEYNGLYDYLKNNVQGLTEGHIEGILALTDGLLGRKFEKAVDVKSVLMYGTNVDEDGDVDLMYAEGKGIELLDAVLNTTKGLY